MVTMDQIRSELQELRYYYSKQRELDVAAKGVGESAVKEKAERYNAAIRKAPVRLYDLYVSLYVHNNTQLVVSLDWDRSIDYIKRLNKKLCLFLQTELEKTEEERKNDKSAGVQ